jgi:hypothetical protein
VALVDLGSLANAYRRGLATSMRRRDRAATLSLVLVGLTVVAAGCGAGSSSPRVASVGKAAATTSEPSAAPSGSKTNAINTALAFVSCMRAHGEPNMPEPNIKKSGSHRSVNIDANAGVDPNSPQFAAAIDACKHLLPNDGVPSAGRTITPADQADYLKGAACMRSHGILDFPDPTFRNNTVTFTSSSRIDVNSSQYKSAVTTCQKLIPAGLPYSSSGG